MARTYQDGDGIVHQVYVATPLREFHSQNWLQCSRENLYHLPAGPDRPVTCLFCLATRPPMLSS